MDLNSLRSKLRAKAPDTISDLRQRAREHAPEAAARREAGYSIANVDDTAVVRVYDEIWWLGVNAEDFVRDISAITAPKIRVEINSPGGDVFDGIAIYNALRTHPAHVTTRVDGIAASIASVIAQAGDHRVVLSSGQMMIHNAWGVTVGDQHDHSEMSALLEQQDDIIAGIYASRSGGDKGHFRELMNAETWLSDTRIVEEGLADEVIEPPRKDAQGSTLLTELANAVDAASAAADSAERVVALRAEAGKNLSQVNRDELDKLRGTLGRIDALLTPTESDSDDIEREFARFVATTQGVHIT